jgi:hypothetical protein
MCDGASVEGRKARAPRAGRELTAVLSSDMAVPGNDGKSGRHAKRGPANIYWRWIPFLHSTGPSDPSELPLWLGAIAPTPASATPANRPPAPACCGGSPRPRSRRTSRWPDRRVLHQRDNGPFCRGSRLLNRAAFGNPFLRNREISNDRTRAQLWDRDATHIHGARLWHVVASKCVAPHGLHRVGGVSRSGRVAGDVRLSQGAERQLRRTVGPAIRNFRRAADENAPMRARGERGRKMTRPATPSPLTRHHP